jgi:putative membrane protein
VNFRRKVVLGLAATCAVSWVIAAIHPFDRQAWILENLLLIIFVAVLSFAGRRLELSTASYSLIAIFIFLHIVGAHYTYEHMPLGIWAKNYFHLSRNHYDRFAHGSFGFLLAFPVRELLLRFSGLRRGWSLWLAVAAILALSGLFEIIESIVAELVAPGQGVNWLAGQGDEWDMQNDMLSAFAGSLLMIAVLALIERKEERG